MARKRARAVLFGGGRAFGRMISMRQMSDDYRSYMMM